MLSERMILFSRMMFTLSAIFSRASYLRTRMWTNQSFSRPARIVMTCYLHELCVCQTERANAAHQCASKYLRRSAREAVSVRLTEHSQTPSFAIAPNP